MSTAHNAADSLSKEAERCAITVARESKAIRDNERELEQLASQVGNGSTSQTSEHRSSTATSPTSGQPVDPEVRMEEFRQNIRKSEVGISWREM